MAKRKFYVILNGKAGRRGLDYSKAEIEKYFNKHDPESEVEFGVTERPMHAAELARQAAQKGEYYAVVAVGGDGTVNEVTNGMAETGATMGIIPNGSTNIFSTTEMKMTADFDQAIKLLLEGVPVRIDAGKVGDRYFIWMLGVGLEAKIANEVNPKIKKYFGVLSYVIAALKQLPTIGFQVMKIVMDDEKQLTFSSLNTVIGNATSFEGIFGIKSRFSIKDGFLDICVFQRWTIVGVLQLIKNFIKGRRDYYRFTDRFGAAHVRTKKMTVDTVPNAWYHVDGEVMGQTPIEVEVREKAITLIVPEKVAGKKAVKKWREEGVVI